MTVHFQILERIGRAPQQLHLIEVPDAVKVCICHLLSKLKVRICTLSLLLPSRTTWYVKCVC